jgi:hypothetical protein
MGIEKNAVGLYPVEIDGRTYEFTKWGAEDAVRILSRLAKIVAEPAGVVVGTLVAGSKGDIKKLLDMNFSPSMVSDAVRALMMNLDEDVCMNIVKKVAAETVLCDGAKITSFNLHYMDKLDHLYDVVRAGMEVQYGNFSTALLARLAAMAPRQRATVLNQVPTTSTGTSGHRS